MPVPPVLGVAGAGYFAQFQLEAWQRLQAQGLVSLAALAEPEVKNHFLALGFEIVGNTPAQFAAFEKQEFARWKRVIKDGKITAD